MHSAPRAGPADPEFDLLLDRAGGPPKTVVVEVKSTTATNEEKQLRLALGQVLRYRHLLQSSDPDVRGFIAIENAPRDPSWVDFCASVSVSLVCPRTSPSADWCARVRES
jgi:hypothetical protein